MLNTKLLGGTASAAPVFIDECFSTYLYTGNGSTSTSNQTITNGIDLAGKGGLVWIKQRDTTQDHALFDTVRGVTKGLRTNLTNAQYTDTDSLSAFNSDGFKVEDGGQVNTNNGTYCSWTFREQAKFFDVVTYTGDGTSSRSIPHNLGSVPGMIIIKSTSNVSDWPVYHRSSPGNLRLNTTGAEIGGNFNISGSSTSTNIVLGTNETGVNVSGQTYVAYLFAHDAGGFGTAGTDNVISCGSFTTDGSGNATVSLGYEPQYLMFKASSATGNWFVTDVMRGFSKTSNELLQPNTSGAEFSAVWGSPTATGFTFDQGNLAPSTTFIYMAIRRPMKPPTSGTQVFSPIISSATTGTTLTTGFPVDLQLGALRAGDSDNFQTIDRLRGISTNSTENNGRYLITSGTNVERSTDASRSNFWDNTGFKMFTAWSGSSSLFYNFRRASGFFDVVCYTGTGSNRTVAHNLGAVPELMIVKRRNATGAWDVYSATLGATQYLVLNNTAASDTLSLFWNDTSPTSSVFSLGTGANVNASGGTYVAYLFATLAGVSKVGTYTGNGSNQTINCGFTAGARFILIKRTDSTGDWYVWDTARGIVSGNDPHLSLNGVAAEVTTNDSVDPDNSGFIVNQLSATNINVTSATYIFLAIA